MKEKWQKKKKQTKVKKSDENVYNETLLNTILRTVWSNTGPSGKKAESANRSEIPDRLLCKFELK